MTAAALILALLATCGLLGSAIAALTRGMLRLLPERAASVLAERPAVRAAVVLLPSIIGLLGLLVLLVPNPFLSCHCATHGLHHPHLCVLHPSFASPIMWPALTAVAVWTATAAPRTWRVARETVGVERWARELGRASRERVDGLDVRLVDGIGLGAFTVGILRPAIVVDRALWAALGTQGRRAIVLHEQAHIERRDGLTLAVLRVGAAITIWPMGRAAVRAWKAASETVCDRHAATVLGDAASVAQALVSVERLRAGLRAPRPDATWALGVAPGADLERRVMALLEGPDAPRTAPLASDLLAIAIVVAGLAALALAWPGDAFHHAVETLIGHIAL